MPVAGTLPRVVAYFHCPRSILRRSDLSDLLGGASNMRHLASFAGGVAAFFVASAFAHAGDPKFSYGKYEEKKEVEWKAAASAGLLLATGNANQLSFTGAAMASRHDGRNRLQLDISGAYARATTLNVSDTNKSGF